MPHAGKSKRVPGGMEDIRVRFGNALRKRRHDIGVSQEEFADMCGLDRTYVGGIERGKRNVSLMNLAKIAKALRVSMSELFKGEICFNHDLRCSGSA